MYLKYIITDELYTEINQDMLNSIADEFLSTYPNSEYEKIVRKHIRYKWSPSKWGFVAEFFTGYGIFTESLESNYTNNIPLGVAFDIYYKNFTLYLRDYIGFSKTKNDIPYDDGLWEKGSQVRVFLPEASLGYVILDNKLIKFAPFAGIASTHIAPTTHDTDNEPSLEKVALDFTTTYTIGFNIDIKLGRSKIPMVSYGPESSYWFLRLRYAFNFPQFENKFDDVNGNMHYLTIGLGGFGSKLKRDY